MLGILAGLWFAYFSLVTSLLVGWYIRNINRRDNDNERRFREMEATTERRRPELLKAVGALYRHVHAGGSPAIVLLPDPDPAIAPTPAGN